KAEAQNARIASDATVNAPLAFFDPDDGAMVTGFIDGGITMTGATFKQRGRPARAAIALHAMHRWKEPFATRFELFAQID
ncbi:hypothetical protein, partial [Salmonella enterica]|uniref:hypothetical protein n=1 Tax=Salmonella enterica TaxID=28901 RepID=UPI003296C6CE